MTNSFARSILAVVSLVLAALPQAAGAVDNPEATWDFHRAQTAIQEGDYEKALPILQRFAEEGSASAQWQLGNLYMDGTGVRQDRASAAMWYRKALSEVPATIPDNPPEPGDAYHDNWNFLVLHLGRLRIMCPDITSRLGAMSFKGEGMPKDDVASYMWFELAKHYGHPKAEVVQQYVGESLADDKIHEAEDRAAKWLRDHARFDDDLIKRYMPN